MSYGYGGRANPFDQRDDGGGGGYGGNNGYGGGGGYGSPQQSYSAPQQVRPPPAAFGQGPRPGGGGAARYNNSPSMGSYNNSPSKEQYSPASEQYNNSPSVGRDDYGSNNVEMASLAQNASSPATNGGGNLLNECQSIKQDIKGVERQLEQLKMMYKKSLTDTNNNSRQIDQFSAGIMAKYRELVERIRQVKSQKDANKPMYATHISSADSALRAVITKYREVEAEFRKDFGEQAKRQYAIVNPNATQAELNQIADDPQIVQQVFQQAMMSGNRQGQARAALTAVQDRDAELQKIEQQIVELAQLMNQMDELVEQQDVQIIEIEQKGEEVVENLDKGNEEMKVAVVTARKTRKKKWICLGICVTIVVIIVVAVVAYVMINRSANGAPAKKRSIDDLVTRNIEWGPEGAPIAAVYAQSKIAADPDAGPVGAPLSHFGRSMRHGKRYIIVDADDLPGGS